MVVNSAILIPGHGQESDFILGGKAENLLRLYKFGVLTPRWIVLGAETLPELLARGDAEAVIQAALETAGIKAEFYAVRSSAVGEDGDRFSFAGQLDSFLFVRRGQLAAAAEKVLRSASNERVTAYRNQHGLEGSSTGVAVIVQEMVEAKSAGVAFAVDLQTGSRRGATVSAVFGLGEGLVSGELPADTYYVNGNEIRSEIVTKSQRVGFNSPDGGTRNFELPAAQQDQPVLTSDEILRVAAMAGQISAALGRIQDIEWAFAGGQLYCLQTRPVTTLDRLADGDGAELIWDNSNIVESYPGVTTPLTFSFIRRVYREVYQQFCLMMGVEKPLIAANAEAFEMLGFIRGRVYYNLLSWYKVLMLLPGYEINAPFMEQMMGVKESLAEKAVIVGSKRGKYRRLGTLIWRNFVNFRRLDSLVKNFQRDFDAIIAPCEKAGFEAYGATDLLVKYREIEQKLLNGWQPPLINDFFAMIFYGVLRKILPRWGIDPHGTLQNNLLIGTGDIISTEPVKQLRRMANLVLDDPALIQFVRDSSNAEFLGGLSKYPQLDTAFHGYLDKFGIRCIGELKLETVTYREDPAPLIDLLRSYVKAGRHDLETARQREQELRLQAEQTAADNLKGHPLRRMIFRFVLKHARKLVRNRENLRFERTRLFAIVRDIFLRLGGIFYREGVIEEKRDIFFLTKEEIFDFIEGTSVSTDLTALISTRKAERQENCAGEVPAERFRTRGPVYCGNTFQSTAPRAEAVQADSLHGIGCCGGVVRAQVRIIRDPSLAVELNGCILVAERTDPGWAPLFPVCAGVLVERGSILSHAAIVTRELGIPSIVGIKDLLASLTDGETVEIDGSLGTVTRIRGEA